MKPRTVTVRHGQSVNSRTTGTDSSDGPVSDGPVTDVPVPDGPVTNGPVTHGPVNAPVCICK